MSFCIWLDVRIFAKDKSQTFEHDFGLDSQPYCLSVPPTTLVKIGSDLGIKLSSQRCDIHLQSTMLDLVPFSGVPDTETFFKLKMCGTLSAICLLLSAGC